MLSTFRLRTPVQLAVASLPSAVFLPARSVIYSPCPVRFLGWPAHAGGWVIRGPNTRLHGLETEKRQCLPPRGPPVAPEPLAFTQKVSPLLSRCRKGLSGTRPAPLLQTPNDLQLSLPPRACGCVCRRMLRRGSRIQGYWSATLTRPGDGLRACTAGSAPGRFLLPCHGPGWAVMLGF